MSIEATATTTEIEAELDSDIETIRGIFGDSMGVIEYDFPEYDRAFDIQLAASSPVNSETLAELREVGYVIDNISPTYGYTTDNPHKYVGITKED